MFGIIFYKHLFATDYIAKGALVVGDINYIKSKIKEKIMGLTEEEKEQAISYIVDNKKTKAIDH